MTRLDDATPEPGQAVSVKYRLASGDVVETAATFSPFPIGTGVWRLREADGLEYSIAALGNDLWEPLEPWP